MSKTSTTPTSSKASYENNPFFVATNGLDLLFKNARSIGILAAVFAVISAFSSIMRPDSPSTQTETPVQSGSGAEPFSSIPPEGWVAIAVALLVILLIVTVFSIVIRGIFDYTSAQLAKNKTATISEAFRAVFSNFWGYTWVLIIQSVKTFLWTLLFIIPGIIMSVRYSLAGVAYFDKKLKGDAAVQRSSQVVKGAWLTTFASQSLFNIITFGFIQPILTPGTNAVLYRQLDDTKTKPKAHFLSWLTLFILLFFLTAIVFFAWALVNYSHAM